MVILAKAKLENVVHQLTNVNNDRSKLHFLTIRKHIEQPKPFIGTLGIKLSVDDDIFANMNDAKYE